MEINFQNRVKNENNIEYAGGRVVWYPVRDLRTQDNYALLYAQHLADSQKAELCAVFVLYPDYVHARARHYDFMFEGLKELEKDLEKLNIPFEVRFGADEDQIDQLVKEGVGAIVTDFSPLHRNTDWKKKYATKCKVPLYTVDAHNVVPVHMASPKQEFAAYTMRPKLYRLLPEYIVEIPKVKKHTFNKGKVVPVDWKEVQEKFEWVKDDKYEGKWRGGSTAAHKTLQNFLMHLDTYTDRNNPNIVAQSDLSPYITFGFISRTRIALEVLKHEKAEIQDLLDKDKNAAKGGTAPSAFIEELIVRAELAENFCHYNKDYDNTASFADWSQKNLVKHAGDGREYIYTLKQFENASTHDTLWNAAQNQMLRTGKMHGYMRMYWAKKVLEWTQSAESAMRVLVYLNDTYSLDGRDPNGYAGIAWSVGGVHDRVWFERPIFGQVRYMNYNGCKSKFNVKEYEEKWNSPQGKLL